MRRKILFAKLIILLTAMPVIVYLQISNMMALHYHNEASKYDDAAMDISSGGDKLHDFDDYHVCLANRYLNAAQAVINVNTFDVLSMAENWNHDFLADQPECVREKQ